MDEFKFVVRCFAMAALFMVLTQIKANDISIEKHIEASLVNSNVSNFVNKVASGGVRLIKDGAVYIQTSYINWKKSETDTAMPEKPDFKKAQAKAKELTQEISSEPVEENLNN